MNWLETISPLKFPFEIKLFVINSAGLALRMVYAFHKARVRRPVLMFT